MSRSWLIQDNLCLRYCQIQNRYSLCNKVISTGKTSVLWYIYTLLPFLHFPRAAYDIGFTFLTTPVVSCTMCIPIMRNHFRFILPLYGTRTRLNKAWVMQVSINKTFTFKNFSLHQYLYFLFMFNPFRPSWSVKDWKFGKLVFSLRSYPHLKQIGFCYSMSCLHYFLLCCTIKKG